MRRLSLTAAAVLAVAAVAVPAFAATRTVKIGDSYFVRKGSPQTITVKHGTTTQFDGGVVPFEASFTRILGDGGSRVELFWQGPGFIKEPLAYQFLGHLAKDRPKSFETDGRLEHGRFKFEELSCAKCHRPAANDARCTPAPTSLL